MCLGGSAGAGVHATPGEFVVEGRFLEWRDESTCTEYYVDNSRKCLTYSHHIVCVEVVMRKRKVEMQLEQQYPDYYSKYSLVTFFQG